MLGHARGWEHRGGPCEPAPSGQRTSIVGYASKQQVWARWPGSRTARAGRVKLAFIFIVYWCTGHSCHVLYAGYPSGSAWAHRARYLVKTYPYAGCPVLSTTQVLRKTGGRAPWKYIEHVAVEEVTFGLAPPQFQFCTAKYDPQRSYLLLTMNINYHSNGFQVGHSPARKRGGLGVEAAANFDVIQR